MTEEQTRAALLRAAQEAVAAKEAAKKTSVSGNVPTERETSPKLADLPPELRTLALRRARFDLGDRTVHREIFGRQEQTTAKGLDFDWW